MAIHRCTEPLEVTAPDGSRFWAFVTLVYHEPKSRSEQLIELLDNYFGTPWPPNAWPPEP